MVVVDDPRDGEIRQLNYLLREERLTVESLNDHLDGLRYELHMRDLRLKEKDRYIKQLQRQIEELKQQNLAKQTSPPLPAFVKLNVPDRPRKRPGRKVGHEAASRKKPVKIDQHQQVPLRTDKEHRPICPHCKCRLTQLKRRRRIVEDLIPSAVEVTCYHTQKGYCPHCRKTVESRAGEQPPAANIPHGQLGINALATAAILRVRHRLPFGQIVQVLKDLPGLSISAGGLVKQIKRLAKWLDGRYQDLIRQMRASKHVHVDETGWRIDGKNFWLWAFTNPTFTLYHVDESRGGKVALKMLGHAFDGTVIADFYGAYDALSGPKQRCLTHLMREVRTIEEQKQLDCPLLKKLMRWCKEALRLKKQWPTLSDPIYQMRASRLEDRLDALMKIKPTHEDSKRLSKRLTRYRAELTRFLWDKELDGTNNAAERAIRPAVVMRKITGGSRSEAGALAWAKLASLLRTADQKALGVFEATKKLITDYWAEAGR
jgi:hypothetical protein